jgi:menaquinone-dependent protoporphyrinogen IX oxidase
MNAIVIYKSKTGFTKKYADWISEELGCPSLSYGEFKSEMIHDYDLIIFGSRIHAGKVDGFSEFKRVLGERSSAKLVVFATGATPAAVEDTIDIIWKTNLSEAERKDIPHFYLQGGLNYEKMGVGDRFIMKMLSKMLSKQKAKKPEESGCEAAISSSHDISSKDFIKPLIECVAGM